MWRKINQNWVVVLKARTKIFESKTLFSFSFLLFLCLCFELSTTKIQIQISTRVEFLIIEMLVISKSIIRHDDTSNNGDEALSFIPRNLLRWNWWKDDNFNWYSSAIIQNIRFQHRLIIVSGDFFDKFCWISFSQMVDVAEDIQNAVSREFMFWNEKRYSDYFFLRPGEFEWYKENVFHLKVLPQLHQQQLLRFQHRLTSIKSRPTLHRWLLLDTCLQISHTHENFLLNSLKSDCCIFPSDCCLTMSTNFRVQ
jgi:hypothetical protein